MTLPERSMTRTFAFCVKQALSSVTKNPGVLQKKSQRLRFGLLFGTNLHHRHHPSVGNLLLASLRTRRCAPTMHENEDGIVFQKFCQPIEAGGAK
jgi:hypothetical protein